MLLFLNWIQGIGGYALPIASIGFSKSDFSVHTNAVVGLEADSDYLRNSLTCGTIWQAGATYGQ